MKVLLYIALYIVVGFVLAILMSRYITKERGYSIHTFDDIDDDEQGLIIGALLLWPFMIIILGIYFVLNLIVIITNRGD